ncbi:hypothetical protein BDN67DRAFT_321321 [Paxillus ammoniavirescens]|nr:hypothetical protein BDN67DRAFT_321321 [Paxillus ammoniavirescens]
MLRHGVYATRSNEAHIVLMANLFISCRQLVHFILSLHCGLGLSDLVNSSLTLAQRLRDS